MNSITQDILYKQSVVKYSLKHGVTKATIKFKMHRKTIYRWREKYDGTAQSLKNKSRKPHSHPNQQRKRVLWASKEQSTSASTEFIKVIMKKFPFKIECIQTDNGFEFTNRLNWQGTKKKTMFENKLEELGIKHKLIKPKTPRHNGKVERSHRKDQERFYYNKVFCSFEDFKNRLKYWEKEYNNFPMKPLKWLSPNEKYLEYING